MIKKIQALLAGPLMVLDIGAHQVKLIEGSVKGNRLYLEKAATLQTPAHAVLDGRILDQARLVLAIEQATKEIGIQAKGVAFTIESDAIINREIILPAVKQDELNAMLEFEIQNYFPIDLGSYRIQKKLLAEFEEEGTKKVKFQVVALANEICQEYLQLAQGLKLKPVALDLHSNCIAKLLNLEGIINQTHSIAAETIAVIDFGHQTSNIMIIEKGVFKFSRLINLGGSEINEHLVNAFNLSFLEAQNKKETAQDINQIENIDNRTAMVLEMIQTSIDQWTRDVDRLFKYYTSRESGNQIHRIFLYGGSSRIAGIENYLTDIFQIPVHVIKEINHIAKGKQMTELPIDIYLNAIGGLIRK